MVSTQEKKMSNFNRVLKEPDVPFEGSQLALVENASNPDELLIVGAYWNHSIYSYNMITKSFTLVANKEHMSKLYSNSIEKDAEPFLQPNYAHRGIVSDTVIVSGCWWSSSTKFYYCVLNTKTLQWEIIHTFEKNDFANLKMGERAIQTGMCHYASKSLIEQVKIGDEIESWLIIAGGNFNPTIGNCSDHSGSLTIFKLNSKTQMPSDIVVACNLLNDEKNQGYVDHGMILLENNYSYNNNYNININDNNENGIRSRRTIVKLLVFGGSLISFENSFRLVDVFFNNESHKIEYSCHNYDPKISFKSLIITKNSDAASDECVSYYQRDDHDAYDACEKCFDDNYNDNDNDVDNCNDDILFDYNSLEWNTTRYEAFICHLIKKQGKQCLIFFGGQYQIPKSRFADYVPIDHLLCFNITQCKWTILKHILLPHGITYSSSVLKTSFKCGKFVQIMGGLKKGTTTVPQKTNCNWKIIIDSSILWKQERIVWIAYYKNNRNHLCLINKLSKDIIFALLTFLRDDMILS